LNISNKLKGKVPWNKGLTKEDDRVKKYINNHIHKKYLKTYELCFPSGEKKMIGGRKELFNYVKNNININLKLKSRINVHELIKNRENKNYTIKLFKCVD
jgi:hypothetical protein